ncbi:hypothetical protein FB451DRAFT_1164260 [Mycena latifolia]|nr:hypothetical protein FB451DRAFT_1164260 [Mycena latifolia]
MEGTSNPLCLPELVDQCLDFLPDSSPDLPACALVSRAWTGAAQRRLFETLSFFLKDQEHMWDAMQNMFRSSPHLIRYVRIIDINADRLSIETLSAVCNISFSHLAHVSLFYISVLSLTMALAFQRLLSLPTLRYVSVNSIFTDPVMFFKMWDGCSAGIRHLELSCSPSDYVLTEFYHPPDSPIFLESLRTPGESAAWLTHAACPFDVSRLKLLSIFSHIEFDWARLALHPFNLSSLPILNFLRISVPVPVVQLPVVISTLSTIPPANQIRKVVLCFKPNVLAEKLTGSGTLGQLDSTLSNVLNPEICTVDFEMDAHAYTRGAPYFPRLRTDNMLRRIEPNIRWFETLGEFRGHDMKALATLIALIYDPAFYINVLLRPLYIQHAQELQQDLESIIKTGLM